MFDYKQVRKMNLVQKLPLGLGLACVMMMSSCSKENVQAPMPLENQANQHSDLREVAGITALLNFPTTNGPTGFDIYAPGWERFNNNVSGSLVAFPTGTSSLTNLWGNALLPWNKALQKIPSIIDMRSILTVTTARNVGPNEEGNKSFVKAEIKHLKPFKKYAITCYVATTIRDVQGFTPAYAERASISISSESATQSNEHMYYVSLTSKEAQWVKKTITYYTVGTKATVIFSAATAQPGQYSYAHIYVDENSIEEVD